jgi:phosphoribosylformylglycinamidine (FGAM) synthase-like amidotransferase family enzyme
MIKSLLALMLMNGYPNTPFTDTVEIQTIFQVDFQDFFQNDTVTLGINGCSIFSNKLLTSDRSTGLTSAIVKAQLTNNAQIKVYFNGQSFLCMYSKDKIFISIIFNHFEKKYEVDLSKGKYIGFSKKDKHELIISQSKRPFIYD